jgi:hypothetical protein
MIKQWWRIWQRKRILRKYIHRLESYLAFSTPTEIRVFLAEIAKCKQELAQLEAKE